MPTEIRPPKTRSRALVARARPLAPVAAYIADHGTLDAAARDPLRSAHLRDRIRRAVPRLHELAALAEARPLTFDEADEGRTILEGLSEPCYRWEHVAEAVALWFRFAAAGRAAATRHDTPNGGRLYTRPGLRAFTLSNSGRRKPRTLTLKAARQELGATAHAVIRRSPAPPVYAIPLCSRPPAPDVPPLPPSWRTAGPVAGVALAMAPEDTRYSIAGICVDGPDVAATDGHRVHILHGTPHGYADGLYRACSPDGCLSDVLPPRPDRGKRAYGDPGPHADVKCFPCWEDVMPRDAAPADRLLLDPAVTRYHLLRASLLTNEESRGVGVWANPDGSVGFTARAPEIGEASVGVYRGARCLGAINPGFLLDGLRFCVSVAGGGRLSRRAGGTGDWIGNPIEFQFPDPVKPVRLRSDGPNDVTATAVTMPISTGDYCRPGDIHR